MFYAVNDFVTIILVGDEKDSDAAGDEGADHTFAKTIQGVLQWLDSLEAICHRVLRSLELRANISFSVVSGDIGRRTLQWKEMSQALDRYGYATPRLQMVVNMLDGRHATTTSEENEEDDALIRDLFKIVGLEVGRIATGTRDFQGRLGEFVDLE